MKTTYYKIISVASSLLLTGFLVACESLPLTPASSSTEVSPDSSAAQESFVSETPVDQEPTNSNTPYDQNKALTDEPPMTEELLSIAVPDFLDEEQQLLYRRAYSLYMHMFGGDTTAIEYFETLDIDQFPPLEYETVNYNGMTYQISQGRYASWADFDAVIHSVFTDNFWAERNANHLYINSDGRLCFVSAERGSGYYYNENFQDEFELVFKSDTEILFTLTGHYTPIWPEGDVNDVEWAEKRKTTYEYTIEFPIKLVLTEHGWRFDKFYTSLGDERSFEELQATSEGGAGLVYHEVS